MQSPILKYYSNIKINTFPDLKLGIGTIKSKEQAETFLNLNTDFLVSPIFDADISSNSQSTWQIMDSWMYDPFRNQSGRKSQL